MFSDGRTEQIVGRERNQLVCYRQLVRSVVVFRRVNSIVRWLFLIVNAFNINRLTVVGIVTIVMAIAAGGQQKCPQSQRRLFGWVRDRETQRPVRDAAITVEVGSGRQKLKSDADGHYVICLPPGTYRLLVAKKKPFARHLVTEIRITGDEDKRVDIDLERWRTINPH